MGRGGLLTVSILMVAVATVLQMFVDWMQVVRDPSMSYAVKAAILAAGGLSLLAALLLAGRGR